MENGKLVTASRATSTVYSPLDEWNLRGIAYPRNARGAQAPRKIGVRFRTEQKDIENYSGEVYSAV